MLSALCVVSVQGLCGNVIPDVSSVVCVRGPVDRGEVVGRARQDTLAPAFLNLDRSGAVPDPGCCVAGRSSGREGSEGTGFINGRLRFIMGFKYPPVHTSLNSAEPYF